MGTKRDEVVKALEVLIAERNFCTNQKYVEACGLFCSARRVMVSDLAKSNHNECTKDCEHYSPPHIYCVLKDALSLLNELSEEIERLRAENEALAISEVKECEISQMLVYRIRDKHPAVMAVIADTVRKMQTEIEARCIKGGIYPAFVKNVVNQVAEEILSGNTPQNNKK